jgi:putative acetyltransferase
MLVRTETAADHAAVAAVVTAAFEGRPEEALLVDLIRRSDGFDPDLTLVADDGGEVVGHVVFSRVGFEGTGPAQVYCLAPLSVHPDRQRRGVGSALTREGLRRLDERGEPMVILEGIPAYYPRFGFEPASAHGIEPPDPGVPDEAFLVRLLGSYRPGMKGRVTWPPAFHESGCVVP